jgi:hypothetical protein
MSKIVALPIARNSSAVVKSPVTLSTEDNQVIGGVRTAPGTRKLMVNM